jgi:hypothetical protein
MSRSDKTGCHGLIELDATVLKMNRNIPGSFTAYRTAILGTRLCGGLVADGTGGVLNVIAQKVLAVCIAIRNQSWAR